MSRTPSRMTTLIRVPEDSGWQDSAPLRWTAQLLVGGLPGALVCLIIMWMASAPANERNGAHIASIMPLLSASGLADTAAFHRLKFEQPASAGHAPQFRVPGVVAAQPKNQPAAAIPLLRLGTPRTAWKHLSPAIRGQIDAGVAQHHGWQRVILHGSGGNQGNARVLSRFEARVRGVQGTAYQFVIGNGVIEASPRWTSLPEARDNTINVCLVGDFNEQSPSPAQLEALDELMDYLSIKLGKLELTTHRNADGGAGGCLGAKFPAVTPL